MLKHSSKPISRTGRRRSSLDTTLFHFDGIQVPSVYMTAFKRIHMKQILQLKGEYHKIVLSTVSGLPISKFTPYTFCTKSAWTLEQFNNSSLGKTIIRKCSGPIKKIQLGIFEIHTKVLWTDKYKSVTDMSGIEDDVPEKILCFLKRSHTSVSLDYVGQQANNLIEKMKVISRGELQGFCVYKNLFTRHREAPFQDFVIEYYVKMNTGKRFLTDIEEFCSEATDIELTCGVFQHHDVVAAI